MAFLGWRHHFIGIGAQDALHHLAAIFVLWLYRDDAVPLLDRFGADVEPKLRLARFLVSAMALEALLREYRAHIAVKVHHCRDRAVLEHVAMRVLFSGRDAGCHQ